MGPIGWFLALSPKVRQQRKMAKINFRIETAIFVILDSYGMKGHCLETAQLLSVVKTWLDDASPGGEGSVERRLIEKIIYELCNKEYISYREDAGYWLAEEGKINLIARSNYARALKSYFTFCRGGYKKYFNVPITSRWQYLDPSIIHYMDW